jgi:hypothetical protein
MAGVSVAASPPAKSKAAAAKLPPEPPGIVPQVILNGVGPMEWNAAVGRERGSGVSAPDWPALRVLQPSGGESLYVFRERAFTPTLIASWPRQDMTAHWVRIFPNWLVVETMADSAARFYGLDGAVHWEARSDAMPVGLGRDLILTRRPSRVESLPPRMSVTSVMSGKSRVSWPALAGWSAVSPLENFLAVNTVGIVDTVSGQRQDELRLMDLEGTILWARTLAADPRPFAVSNFGDVAIARERQLLVFDRTGAEKLRVPIPRNSVGRTAISADGRFALVATSAPVGRHGTGGIWVALFDTSVKTAVWSRKNLPVEGGKLAEVTELSLSDDGQRALVRLTTGPVFLLGPDGKRVASWNLERISRGEFDPEGVPRRTWLSGSGELVAFTMPVAPSISGARGWLFRVPR